MGIINLRRPTYTNFPHSLNHPYQHTSFSYTQKHVPSLSLSLSFSYTKPCIHSLSFSYTKRILSLSFSFTHSLSVESFSNTQKHTLLLAQTDTNLDTRFQFFTIVGRLFCSLMFALVVSISIPLQKSIFYLKCCRWLDSNPCPLVS